MKLITVEDDLSDVRIDKYLIDKLGISRTKIQNLITNDKVMVNDKNIKNSHILRVDDIIKIDDIIEENIDVVPEDIKLNIVYEDDDVIVVNKESGMVVHPSLGHYSGTLVNALMFHCNLSTNGIRPGIVHRIDKDTSGLLLVAKNDNAHLKLSEQLSNRSITRKYIALVHGVIMHDTGTIDAPIGRDLKDRKKMAVTETNSKEAVTNFKVIERFKNATLIECKLETGRTHQIRVHLSYIGFPIVNDPIYGRKKTINDYGQLLHAKTVGFIHPVTNEYMEFTSDLPEEFNNILDTYRDLK